jgi:hypothetical protein
MASSGSWGVTNGSPAVSSAALAAWIAASLGGCITGMLVDGDTLCLDSTTDCKLRDMKQAIFGTFPVVYPSAATYFDLEATCALPDARCDGPVKVHAYFYIEGSELVDTAGEIVAEMPSAAELLLDNSIDYIELCSVHHHEWWEMQRQEYRARIDRQYRH